MIKSMTGFGKSEFEFNHRKITLEIKSLNSKQADINSRIPPLYREKEIDIRREIADKLVRGKIDFAIYVESQVDSGSAVINESVVKSYFSQLSNICKDLNINAGEALIQTIMRLPDTVKVNYETLEEEEWRLLHKHIAMALNQVNNFRIQEGNALESDLRANISSIMDSLEKIEPFEQKRIDSLKGRLTDNLDNLQLNGGADPNRFEQELIYYLERLDFNEEKVRLSNHCSYFLETMNDMESNGKKLSFIAQEIGREVNTIGSKANESNIQRLVVQMKDSLERIKEQVLNVL